MRRREVWMLMVALQVGICPFVASIEPAAGAPEPPQLRGESLEMRTSRNPHSAARFGPSLRGEPPTRAKQAGPQSRCSPRRKPD